MRRHKSLRLCGAGGISNMESLIRNSRNERQIALTRDFKEMLRRCVADETRAACEDGRSGLVVDHSGSHAHLEPRAWRFRSSRERPPRGRPRVLQGLAAPARAG